MVISYPPSISLHLLLKLRMRVRHKPYLYEGGGAGNRKSFEVRWEWGCITHMCNYALGICNDVIAIHYGIKLVKNFFNWGFFLLQSLQSYSLEF